MRILQLHCDNISYEPTKKEIQSAEEIDPKPVSIDEVVVCFVAVENDDTENIAKECSRGSLFFSFAFDRKLAGECIYLINFFPEDDLLALFNSFKTNSKIALLYPENNYGYYINSIIDSFATKSNSIIVSRSSYKEDLSNARDAIKKLSKYELRKHELERQKTILKAKNDEASKKSKLILINYFLKISELVFKCLGIETVEEM